jgi:outer membrane protein OmpA-like peptidoglycan-associated protein
VTKSKIIFALLLLPFASFAWTPVNAETIGYSEAVDQFAVSCGADIAKFCKNANLGGGRIQQCLNSNKAGVSARCTATMIDLQTLIAKRAAARTAVTRVCDSDIKRLCAGIQAGDGNLMECFYSAKKNMSAQCRQTVEDAGFEVRLAPSQSTSQVALDPNQLVTSLQGVDAAATSRISAASLRQLVATGMADPSRRERANRAPLTDTLNNLAQFTIAIQFDFGSSRIRPDSFKAVGLMADALNHPYLLGYRFIIVGHTDAVGSRETNLKLSQQRADAVREALINPFQISAARLDAVGFGEEQLLNRGHPEAAENRRVQLINIGK